MVVQAVVQVRLQYSAQVLSLYTASVLFYLAGFILWNLGRVNRKIKNFGDFKLQKNQQREIYLMKCDRQILIKRFSCKIEERKDMERGGTNDLFQIIISVRPWST